MCGSDDDLYERINVLEEENERLLEAAEWVCGEINKMYVIAEDGTEDYKYINWNLAGILTELGRRMGKEER
jgi:hypothetical protein